MGKLKRENACFRSDTKASSTSNVRRWDTTLLGVLQATKRLLLRKLEKKFRAMRTSGASVNVEEAGERAARAVNGGNVHPCNQPGDPCHIDLFNLVMISVVIFFFGAASKE